MAPPSSTPDELFPLRVINFLGRDVPVLGQNAFGPCGMLAVVNALLLRNAMQMSPDLGHVSLEDLLARLADQLMERNGARAAGSDEAALNVRRALDEAIARLPTLAEGLDVNVKFGGDALFEFTPELAIFDLLDLALVHGWRVDAGEDPEAALALGGASYNEVVARVARYRAGDAADPADAALSDFLDRTASQLTFAGLVDVCGRMRDREIAVLYRNMHFSTVFKHQDSLYLLVTDVGYRHEPRVVWEKLDAVDGDTELVDGDFRPSPVAQSSDADALLALQLAQGGREDDLARALELSRQQEPVAFPGGVPVAAATEVAPPSAQEQADRAMALQLQGSAPAESDEAMARRLQAESYAAPEADSALARQLFAEEEVAARRRTAPAPARAKKKSNCSIS
mmetsp:Transcript_9861/g.29495  ORF Transcript_9861/g.29495 Transcript_9861/m.29495 type:complete len:398 (-) Transcript_9861:27-1220(-)